jgi:hypothetical protein
MYTSASHSPPEHRFHSPPPDAVDRDELIPSASLLEDDAHMYAPRDSVGDSYLHTENVATSTSSFSAAGSYIHAQPGPALTAAEYGHGHNYQTLKNSETWSGQDQYHTLSRKLMIRAAASRLLLHPKFWLFYAFLGLINLFLVIWGIVEHDFVSSARYDVVYVCVCMC